MVSRSAGRRYAFSSFLVVAALACGGADADDTASAKPATEARGDGPCDVLTGDEVASVLPGAGEGYVAMDGGSLTKGVDSYQCSYANSSQEMLIVAYHKAADAEGFDWVKPKASSLRSGYGDSLRQVDVGDEGYLYGEPGDMRLSAAKGLHVVEIELISPDAGARADAMVPIGTAVLERID